MFNSRFSDITLTQSEKTPVGKRRFAGRDHTPRSARKKSHLDSQSLHASHILQDTTSKFEIETFGLSLPVLITDTLTLSDRSTTEITACIDPSGWAWLVGGRKLFVWRYKSAENTRTSQCKELNLPPSDLAHNAERVCLIPGNNQDGQPLACVAVSPEGVVRYWPKVSFETSTVDISAELRGEECARVVNFQPYGCLLATTTSSLLLLEPIAGQAMISCRPLKSSQGLFSGISRRMSSFVFGSLQMQTNEAPLQAILAAPEDQSLDDEDDEDRRMFYVLSDTHLSKWTVPSIGTEKLIYQAGTDRLFREALAQKVWEQDSVQLPHLKTWQLDIQLTRDGIVMLGAGVNLEVNKVVYFALVYLQTLKEDSPTHISKFTLLDYTQPYIENDERHIASFKLLLPEYSSKTTFMYNKDTILCLQDDESLDKMDLKTPGDIVLGAGRCDGTGMFFSNVHGIFSIDAKPSFSALNESNNQSILYPRAELESMVLDSSKLVELTDSSDEKTKLKGAFIAFLSGDQDSVQTVLDELAPLSQRDPETEESGLDKIVADVSKDMVDDIPNADPRWAETDRKDSSSSTASVIIIQQLKDKQKAHDYFINFLKSCGLFDQLSLVQVRGSPMSTRLFLCENVEKVEAAIALRELHSEHCKIIDPCIKTLIKKRGEIVPPTLTPQDMFYRRVSSIQDIIESLVEYVDSFLTSDHPSKKIISVIRSVNAIFVDMLHYALKYRQANAEMYAGNHENIPEYIPWTATENIRTAVSKQIMTSLDRGVSEARDVDVQGVIFQNVVGLSDILMDGYASQVKSLQQWPDKASDCTILERKFEKERHNFILPLVKHKQYDRAASLAEKYEDFEMLMVICDTTDNQERLQRYRSQFADKGFSQFLFQWYLKEGKRGHLLSQPVAQGDELSRFLDSDNVKYLSWLHEIQRGNFVSAHHVLSELASVEKNFLAKKKTLLSLSKLSALAADDETDSLQEGIEVINEELDLVLHQEQLPTEAVENAAMDAENMRVLTPRELIELYVSEKNTNAGEMDVKKALDLLRYIDQTNADDDYEQLKLHIWSRAILMDDWSETDETDPLDSNRDKVFMKTVDLVYMDGNLESLLPSLKTLLSSSELAELCQQPHFQFLIKGGYEEINRALSTMD